MTLLRIESSSSSGSKSGRIPPISAISDAWGSTPSPTGVSGERTVFPRENANTMRSSVDVTPIPDSCNTPSAARSNRIGSPMESHGPLAAPEPEEVPLTAQQMPAPVGPLRDSGKHPTAPSYSLPDIELFNDLG